jgi:hypothetical protein
VRVYGIQPGECRLSLRRKPIPMNETHNIRVWLDDVREAPAGWTRAYTAREAIGLLEAGGVVEISLDHDLGDEATCGTGYQVATWIEEAVATQGFEPPTIAIHSANVVGRERMQRAIDAIERFRRRGA